MKFPKNIRTYCSVCRKHTEHIISQSKVRERGSLKKYSIQRLAKRSAGKTGYGNKGRYSRKAITAYKRVGAKTSKRIDLRLKCKECSKSSVKRLSSRTKKFIFE